MTRKSSAGVPSSLITKRFDDGEPSEAEKQPRVCAALFIVASMRLYAGRLRAFRCATAGAGHRQKPLIS